MDGDKRFTHRSGIGEAPVTQSPQDLPPWRADLLKALHLNRSKPESKYVQFATVKDGLPDNRTLVFRGFHDEAQLLFYTDTRSAKFSALCQTSYAAACWYFTKSREQYRLSGHCNVYTRKTADPWVSECWQALSPGGRATFVGHAPGIALSQTKPIEPVNSIECPDSFAVIALQPEWVDHLVLRGDTPTRFCHRYCPPKGWQSEQRVP